MKNVVFLLIILALCGCASTSDNPWKKDFVRFSVQGGSYGVAPDAQYFVIVEDDALDNALKQRLANYASYILEYRGFYETTISHMADYYLIVSFQPYTSKSGEQYYQIAAVSRRVYDAVQSFKPRWWATSVHYGKPKYPETILAMHALSIRDIAGSNPDAYHANASYLNEDEIVLGIKSLVEK